MRFRFKKGDRVEILSKRQVPTGSWLCGTLLSGNGHTYYIRYESLTGPTGAPVVEKVPRKAIRPCPPVNDIDSWAVGDSVEVFHSSSWKLATVLKVVDLDVFLVRLRGTTEELEVHKSSLRLPQSWQSEEWVTTQKVSRNGENGKYDQKFSIPSHKSLDKQLKRRHLADDCFPTVRETGFQTRHVVDDYYPTDREAGIQTSHMVTSGTLKRGSPCNLTRGAGQKFRASEKDGTLQRMVPENGKQTWRTQNGDLVVSAERNLDFKGAERSTSSIRSAGSDTDTDTDTDMDTDNKEQTWDETHKFALDAYHGLLESLRAYGYMSWEQEEMLTDLRLKLNISNDEHLMELRKLVSTK